MRIFKFGNLCLLASLAALTGCLEREFSEAEGVMSVDTREIVVPADMYEGRNLVTDTIFVTSNRSWSAAFEEDVDWVKMDTTGHQDMARVSEVTPLVFRFKDNETESERSVKVKINCADGDREITLRQEPIKYRLDLISSTDGFESIKSDGDTLKLSFNTNTLWTISAKGGGTASLSFPVPGGKYTAKNVIAVVKENEELITKDAVIVISSPYLPKEKWIEIHVGQLEGFPYFRFTDSFSNEAATDTTALDGVGVMSFKIKTNSNWKCELVSAEGFGPIEKMISDATGQTWSPISGSAAVPGDVIAGGDRTMTSATLNFPATMAFGTEPKLVVKFTADGVADSRTITIHQTPCVRWWYGILDDSHMWKSGASVGALSTDGSTYGLSYPPISGTGVLPNSGGNRINIGKEITFITKSGVSFRVYTPYGMWKNGTTTLMIGRGQGTTWIEIPAIEGVAIKKIVVTNRANTSALAFDVQSFDGTETVLSGCSFAGQGTQKEFELTGTKKNFAYRMLSQNTSDMCIGDMIWYYE